MFKNKNKNKSKVNQPRTWNTAVELHAKYAKYDGVIRCPLCKVHVILEKVWKISIALTNIQTQAICRNKQLPFLNFMQLYPA